MGKNAVSGIMLLILLIGMLIFTFYIQPAKAEPRTWTVDDDGPADFHTIQEAINYATSGDTVFVKSGIYYENVVINKVISLVGEERDTTIIDGNHTGDVIQGSGGVNINGFTLQNGLKGVKSMSATLTNVLIQDNNGNGVEAYGIYLTYCVIKDNSGHGIYNGAATPLCSVFGCVIHNNTGRGVEALGPYGGVSISYSNITENRNSGIAIIGSVHFSNIYNNTPYDVVAGFYHIIGSMTVDATYNWWGTTNTSLIDEHIYDYHDDSYHGIVYYQPFLMTPMLEAVLPPHIENVHTTSYAPNYDENVIITAIVRDGSSFDMAKGLLRSLAVHEALLSYTCNSAWHNVSMNRFDDTFNATIPAQPDGTNVEYKIYANDTNGNWAESTIYSYQVIDTVKPEIVSVNWSPTNPTPDDFVKVTVNVSEPVNASGVKEALLSLQDNFGQRNITMTYDGTNALWTLWIPKQPYNTTVQFCVMTYDNAGNLAISQFYNYTISKSYIMPPEQCFFIGIVIGVAVTISATIIVFELRKRRAEKLR